MRNPRTLAIIALIGFLLSLGVAGWLFWERTSIVSENATITTEWNTLKDQITKADEVQDTNRQLQDQVEDLQNQLRAAQSGEANPVAPTPVDPQQPPTPDTTPIPGTEQTPTPGGTEPPADVLALMQTIETEVTDLREIPETRPVTRRFMNRDELRAYIESEMAEENNPEEMQNSQLELWLLGLSPRDIDLESLLVELQTEQIAGFYDPEVDTFYLIGDNPELPPVDQITYAHEFTHNLQDQVVDLNLGITANEFDSDRSMAYRSLVEGDASLAMQFWTQQYLLQKMTPEEMQGLLQELQSQQQGSNVLDQVPAIIRESLMFPYQEGLAFAQTLHDTGGWELVNQALQDPPTSSEQILHPEKYLSNPRENTTLPERFDLSNALAGGWTIATTNTLGEFDLRVLLGEIVDNISSRDRNAGAAGIDGIRYALYKQASTDNTLLQMTMKWDSASEGDEFLALYESGLKSYADLWQHNDVWIGIKGRGEQFTILYSSDQTIVEAALTVQP